MRMAGRCMAETCSACKPWQPGEPACWLLLHCCRPATAVAGCCCCCCLLRHTCADPPTQSCIDLCRWLAGAALKYPLHANQGRCVVARLVRLATCRHRLQCCHSCCDCRSLLARAEGPTQPLHPTRFAQELAGAKVKVCEQGSAGDEPVCWLPPVAAALQAAGCVLHPACVAGAHQPLLSPRFHSSWFCCCYCMGMRDTRQTASRQAWLFAALLLRAVSLEHMLEGR